MEVICNRIHPLGEINFLLLDEESLVRVLDRSVAGNSAVLDHVRKTSGMMEKLNQVRLQSIQILISRFFHKVHIPEDPFTDLRTVK